MHILNIDVFASQNPLCSNIFLLVDLFFTDDLEWGRSFMGRDINNLESELILNTTQKPHEI